MKNILCGFFAVFIFCSLSGCATSYSSIRSSAGGDVKQEIIVGEDYLVVMAIQEAIQDEFPAADVQVGTDKSFRWYHQPVLDRTTYRLSLTKVAGFDSHGKNIEGYYYRINTSGSQVLVDSRYVSPLNKAIQRKLVSKGLSLTTVSGIQEFGSSEMNAKNEREVERCFVDLASATSLDVIRKKIALGGSHEQTFSMLADTSIPTPAEQQAILLWGEGRFKCVQLVARANETRRVHPQIRASIQSLANSQQTLLAQLYRGSVNYGDYAAKRASLSSSSGETIAAIQAELAKQDAAAADRAKQLALQADQNMAAILSAASLSTLQQQNSLLRQPRLQTTCSFIGSTMYCN